MQSKTYEALPLDVQSGLTTDTLTLDESIPVGMVDVYNQGRRTRVSVNAFVRMRRKTRKAKRQNRKNGQNR